MVVFLLALRDTVEVVVILDDDMKGFDDEDADCLGLLEIESKTLSQNHANNHLDI